VPKTNIYTGYTNGPDSLDHMYNVPYSGLAGALTPGVDVLWNRWQLLQATAQSRGIIFYPEITQTQIQTSWNIVFSCALIRRLERLLGIPEFF